MMKFIGLMQYTIIRQLMVAITSNIMTTTNTNNCIIIINVPNILIINREQMTLTMDFATIRINHNKTMITIIINSSNNNNNLTNRTRSIIFPSIYRMSQRKLICHVLTKNNSINMMEKWLKVPKLISHIISVHFVLCRVNHRHRLKMVD